MQTTEDHLGLDITHNARPNRPRHRTVFFQPQVSPAPMVVVHILPKHPLEVLLIEGDPG